MRKTGWRRLLALAACAAMALGLLPGTVPAAKADDLGTDMLYVNERDIVGDGGTVRGQQGEARLVYDMIPGSPVLVLDNYKYSGRGYTFHDNNLRAIICYTGSIPLGVYIVGTNEINCTSGSPRSCYGIYSSNADLYFFGLGSLNVSSLSSQHGYGIYSAKTITLKTCAKVTAAGTRYGIYSLSSVTIQDCLDVEATGGGTGIRSEGYAIENSTVTATGSEEAGIYDECAYATITNSNVTARGGTFGIYATGDYLGKLFFFNCTVEAIGGYAGLFAWAIPPFYQSDVDTYVAAPAGGDVGDVSDNTQSVFAPNEAVPAKRVKIIPKEPGKTPLLYDPGSGSGQMDSEFVAMGETYTFPECTFTAPPGYKFHHWKMSGVDGLFYPNTTVTIAVNCVQEGKITVTAHWKSAPPAVVTKAPEAKDLTYTGENRKLVTAGEAQYGAMSYARGKDDQTAPTGVWSDQVPEASQAGTYYVWYKAMGDAAHSDSAAKCVTVKIRKASQAAPAAPVAESVTETSVTLKETDGYQYSLDGTAWQDSCVFSGLTPGREYTFFQRIVGDVNHEPSPASPGTSITPGTISYLITEHKGTEHTIGSGEDAVYTVKRNVDDGETFTNYTESTMDGKAIPEGGSSVKEGSLILTLKSSYLDTLAEGTHQVGISFTDGSVKSSLKIAAVTPTPTPTPTPVPPTPPTPTPKPRPVPRTGDPGNPALWILLGLAGIAGLAALGSLQITRKKKKDR